MRFDEHGAVVTVGEKGKTGARTLRLIYSVPYVREWLECHPYRDDKNKPLFITMDRRTYGDRMEPPALRTSIQRAAKLAGIDKHMYSYIFRHASITREAGNGWGDQELKTFYGWTPDSRMLKVYSHLTSEDVNRKRLEMAGIIKTKEKIHELNLRKCPRCGADNTPTADYCNKCSSPLNEQQYRELLSKTEEVELLKRSILALGNTVAKLQSPKKGKHDIPPQEDEWIRSGNGE